MANVEHPNPPAAPSLIPDRRERLATQLRRAEAFLHRELQRLDGLEGRGGETPRDGSGVPNTTAHIHAGAHVELPACDAPRVGGGVPSILIVDLYDTSRAALGELIRTCGYAVLEAGCSGDLSSAGEITPLLIVFDPGPHLDAAIRTVARIQIERTAPPVPIILLSATITSDQRERALAIGISHVLMKPCPPAELISGIVALVGPPPPGGCPDMSVQHHGRDDQRGGRAASSAGRISRDS